MTLESIKMFGVADCHGIESFVPYTKDTETARLLFALDMRAMANRQRHAVVYIADLPKGAVENINKKLRGTDPRRFKASLEAIKKQATRVLFYENGRVVDQDKPSQYMKSWGLIPNDDLDPFF